LHGLQNCPVMLFQSFLRSLFIPSFYPVYERDMTTGEYILDENGNRVYDYGTYRKGSYNGYNFAQSMLYDKKEYKRDAASIRGYLQIILLYLFGQFCDSSIAAKRSFSSILSMISA
jgi:hypothetical protein